MPAIQFKSNGLKAVSLYNYSTKLEGDDAQFRERAQLREKILAVWPEVNGEVPEQRPDEADFTPAEKEAAKLKRITEDQREFTITATQQTALAEGFLKYIQDRSVKDADKEEVLKLASLIRCRKKFIESRISKSQIREFAESDDEVELDDAPAAK